jgi:flagellar motility protein MotE (MotC chaperone)
MAKSSLKILGGALRKSLREAKKAENRRRVDVDRRERDSIRDEARNKREFLKAKRDQELTEKQYIAREKAKIKEHETSLRNQYESRCEERKTLKENFINKEIR